MPKLWKQMGNIIKQYNLHTLIALSGWWWKMLHIFTVVNFLLQLAKGGYYGTVIQTNKKPCQKTPRTKGRFIWLPCQGRQSPVQ